MSEPQSLRDQWTQWTSTHSTTTTSASGGIAESAKSLFSNWSESLNTSANDVYQRLPFTQQDLEANTAEPSWFALTKFERILGFFACLLGSIVCFTLSFVLFPVLALKPRKFGLLWSLGSLLFVISFGVMMGPMAYFKHLTSRERLPFSVFFFGTCFATVYFSGFKKNTLMTLICSILEIIAVLYYSVSYFPFGAQGLRMISAVGARQVGNLII